MEAPKNRAARREELFSKRADKGKYHGDTEKGKLAHKAAVGRAKIKKEHHLRNVAARKANKEAKLKGGI